MQVVVVVHVVAVMQVVVAVALVLERLQLARPTDQLVQASRRLGKV